MSKNQRIEHEEVYTELTLELPLYYPEEFEKDPPKEDKPERGVIIIDLLTMLLMRIPLDAYTL
jgi:hypothetical protein